MNFDIFLILYNWDFIKSFQTDKLIAKVQNRKIGSNPVFD